MRGNEFEAMKKHIDYLLNKTYKEDRDRLGETFKPINSSYLVDLDNLLIPGYGYIIFAKFNNGACGAERLVVKIAKPEPRWVSNL